MNSYTIWEMDWQSASQAGGIGLLAVAIIYIVNGFLKHMEKHERRSEEREARMRQVINKNTRITQEVYRYLKLRNGGIEKELKALARSIKNLKK